MEFFRQRAQRLGQQAKRIDLDRELAGPGLEQHALGGKDVAHVPLLEAIVEFVADVLLRDEQLDAAGGVLQGGEAGLAHHPLQHHAPGHGHADIMRLQLFARFFAVLGMQVASQVRAAEIVGEGDALLAQRAQFGTAVGDDMAFVLNRWLIFLHAQFKLPASNFR
ncbi:hypothetical protein GALL_381680 [mine drainage metagenome]|uniref:Uncharacterized protein n=1 Tax=mine drainage metagenome TaxID=410659 RepID=A0A1J5QA76_9ZZZZ